MPDPTTTQVAESSTATQAPVAPVEVPTVPTDPTAYAEWRQSGKLPETKPEAKAKEPKPEEAATSKESEAGKEASTEKQEPKAKPHPGAKERLDEILADLRAAGLSPAELKTFKRELKQADTPPPAKASEQTAKPAGLEPPTKPKQSDFDDWDKFEEARDKYHEDLADYKARKAVEEYRQSQAAEAQQRDIEQKMQSAQERYGDGAKEAIISTVQTIMGDAKIPDVLKDVLGDSPVLTDILYVLGSKADELAEFVALAHTKPTAAIRKIGVIESLVQAELTKGDGKQRGEDGKFVPAPKAESKAPEKKAPEVPPPPKELSGRGSVPPDEVENALKTGDFRAFKAAQDRRDIAKIRGH